MQLTTNRKGIWSGFDHAHHCGSREVENFAAAPEFCHKNCAVKSKKTPTPGEHRGLALRLELNVLYRTANRVSILRASLL